MIVVDTSALVAIIALEPEERRFTAILAQSQQRLISAASVLELTMVMSGRIADTKRSIDRFIALHGLSVEPVDMDQLNAAQDAFLAYGKGRHPAALNFGDCFSYALATSRRAPLLYKGADFALTGIAPAAHSR